MIFLTSLSYLKVIHQSQDTANKTPVKSSALHRSCQYWCSCSCSFILSSTLSDHLSRFSVFPTFFRSLLLPSGLPGCVPESGGAQIEPGRRRCWKSSRRMLLWYRFRRHWLSWILLTFSATVKQYRSGFTMSNRTGQKPRWSECPLFSALSDVSQAKQHSFSVVISL